MIDSVTETSGGFDSLPRSKRRKPDSSLAGDRLPPHSAEAEQGVLGCILLDPNASLGLCLETLKDGSEAFYDLRHREIYAALVEMYDQREAIDVITVQQRLKDRKLLDQVGGISYLLTLQDAVPSASNVTYYADILQEKHQMRRIIQTCTNAVAEVYDHTGEVESLLDGVERDILSLRRESACGQKPVMQLVQSAIDRIEVMHQRRGEIGGIASGFPDLDRMTDGFHGGEMIVIAGRPSLGKTSLAMNIVEHAVLNLQIPVGVFSLEMQSDQLMLRSLCSLARVNLRNIRGGFMSEADFPKLTLASGRMSKAPLFIDDTAGLSIMQFRARARRLVQQHGIKLLVLDYLQLLHSTNPRCADNRQQEIADISSGIKSLAKELNLPILVLSQLNRELEKERGRKPKLSHLRESGSIEQDADVVGLLYRSGETEAETEDESDALAVNLLIAKQRNGPTGEVHLTFLKTYTRFESSAKVDQEDLPDHARNPHND